MKKIIKINKGNVVEEKEVNYIPVRYIIAILITILEVVAIIGIVLALCYFVPYFYILAIITTVACELKIIASDDNPDYKIPWILCVLILPVAGFMLYFIFYSRKLKRKYIKRLNDMKKRSYDYDDFASFEKLKKQDELAYSQAKMLCNIAETHLFEKQEITYFASGEEYFESLLKDLKTAEKFIYLEYFIIEEGKFWNSLLDVLKEKASLGLEVKVVFDDIGCMRTLPGDYAKTLKKFKIEAVPFSRLRGQADSEFNNRNHRKIAVIDGKIGYTGGINLADEYINEVVKFGHWKDSGIRIYGDAVYELTKLFMIDFGINVKKIPERKNILYPKTENLSGDGFVIPFGDGPKPLYERRVGKSVIENMLASATKYAYITSPYLILDNELCAMIENTALRGVDVKIIVPHIPDKKIILNMTRSYYKRLINAGVEIYEYEPGFIHAKSYISDDKYAMVGTINLDYRSLVHHFENGVFMMGCSSVFDIKNDIIQTLEKCEKIEKEMLKTNLANRIFRSLVRIFAPML